jgi:hypothetical protein
VGACGHVLSCHAVNTTVSQDPDVGKAYHTLKALGWSNWMPGPILGREGWRTRQTGGEILPTHDYRNEGNDGADYSQVKFFLDWWPSFSTRSSAVISGMGCVAPQRFAASGNRLHLDL